MPGELNESQIRKTAIYLGLPADFICKDYFVTKAIRLLTGIQDDYFELIFQGGTSLSKGYCLINRLSEDIDFRVRLKDSANKLIKCLKKSIPCLSKKHLKQMISCLIQSWLCRICAAIINGKNIGTFSLNKWYITLTSLHLSRLWQWWRS